MIRHVGSRELARRRRLKEAIKATKNKLHQVGAAYFVRRANHERWLKELRQAASSKGRRNLREDCARIMAYHASTRERLPILERFYTTVLRDVSPVRSALDVACGFNPLAIP